MPKAQQKITRYTEKQGNMAQSKEQNKTLDINPNEAQIYELPHTHQHGYYHKTEISDDKDVEKLEPLCTVGGIVKRCNCYGKQYKGYSKS